MVKCQTCGFLEVRDEYTDEVREASETTRLRGLQITSSQNTVRAKVFCCKDARDLTPLWNKRAEDILEAICKEIDCPQYVKRMPGKTGKDHEEMQFLQQVENRITQWRSEDVKWRQDVEAALNRRQDDALRIQADALQKTVENAKRADEKATANAMAAQRSQRINSLIAVGAIVVSIATAVAHWWRILFGN